MKRTNGQATAFMRAAGAPMIEVDMDTLDIARRITEGDELWRGDPNMELVYNDAPGVQRFEVLGVDAKGQPYIAAWGDECDQRLLVQLAETDWRLRSGKSMLDELVRREQANQKAADSARKDFTGELAEKAAWGIKRALAAHLGGRSWSYSMNSGRR